MSRPYTLSRMGVKFTFVASVALAIALGVYLLLSESVSWFLYDERFSEYWMEREQVAIENFQNYVTEKKLTAQAAIQDVEWEKGYRTMYLYLETEALDIAEAGGQLVQCADRNIIAFAYPNDSYYDSVGKVLALSVSALLFFLILLPYFYHILHRIMRLSQKMEILSGGDLSYQIHSPGRDELAELGRSIEEMRLSVLEQMARENEAVTANSRLITSLSHDLRTPLTKLMGYLELLQYKKYKNEEDYQLYLQRAIEKAQQMRDMSDEMFRHFEIQKKTDPELEIVPVSGAVFLSQLISEQCWELQAEGFDVQPPVMEGSYLLQIRVEDVKRIFDNLFSNLKKYSDPQYPIDISTGQSDQEIWISIENHIKENRSAESCGIGVPTVKMLMEQNNGQLQAEQKGNIYRSSLRFQKLI